MHHFNNFNKVGMLISKLQKSQPNDGDNIQQQNSSSACWVLERQRQHTILTNWTVPISTPQHWSLSSSPPHWLYWSVSSSNYGMRMTWLIILSIITVVRHAQTFMLCTIYTVKRLRQLQVTSAVRLHFAESQPANSRRVAVIKFIKKAR